MKRSAPQWDSRIGRRLRLRDLHIFFAVIEHKSMARAAVHLGIAQPSVSEAIADLEHAVGVQLLDRSRQGVLPTAYGRALQHRGQAAFDELRQGIRDIEFLADPTVGELRISCPETLTAGYLPAVIDKLANKYPRIVFRVIQSNTGSQFRDLRERSVDLALARLTKPLDDDDFDAKPLFDDQVFIVGSASHALARRRKVKFSELANEPWIGLPPDNDAGSFIAEAFEASGVELPKPTVVTFSQHLRFHLLAKGRYLTALPASVLRFNADHFSLKSLSVDLPFRPRPVAIVTLKNRLLSPVATMFVDYAVEVAKTLVKPSS
jgi:DNA-binding transcriptional LysR family regulator